jgi:hypothetical protein
MSCEDCFRKVNSKRNVGTNISMRGIHPSIYLKFEAGCVSSRAVRPFIIYDLLFVVVRFAKNIASDTDTIITTFEQSLAKLRADFLAGIDVATVIAVLDIRSTVLDTTKLVTQTHHVVAENQRVGLETKDVVLDIQQTLGKIGLYPKDNIDIYARR